MPWVITVNAHTQSINNLFVCLLPHLQKFAVKNEYFNSAIYNNLIKSHILKKILQNTFL